MRRCWVSSFSSVVGVGVPLHLVTRVHLQVYLQGGDLHIGWDKDRFFHTQ